MTTELTKAAQQGLACLRYLKDQSDCDVDPFRWMQSKGNAAIDALERALTQRPAAQAEREAFEAWATSVGYHTERDMFQRDKYQSTVTWELWRVWQARASLPAPQQATPDHFPGVVEMVQATPEPVDPNQCDVCGAQPANHRTTPEPVEIVAAGWLEAPHGKFRRNPMFRVSAPLTVGWSIPLYAEAFASNRPAPGVPEGFALVPVEPTPEMKAEGIKVEVYSEASDSIGALTWAEVAAIYRAMLAAAQAKGAGHE